MAVLVLVIGGAVLGASPAAAHSELLRSDPADGGLVPVGRTSLTLTFGEPVAPSLGTFTLRTDSGARVPTTVASQRSTDAVRLTTDPLAKGTYTLAWKVLSVDDGHSSTGSLVFGAGVRPAVLGGAGSSLPSAGLVAVRWVDLGGMLLAVGALAVGGDVVAAGPAGPRMRRRARTLGAAGAFAAACAALLLPFERALEQSGALGQWWDQGWLVLTGTTWGRLWLVREVALVSAGTAIMLWRRPRGGRSAAVALGSLTVAAVLESFGGHASSLPDGSTLAVLAGTAHLLAAGVWAGGLVVLLLCGALPRGAGDRGRELRPMWRAYSPMAAVATVVLLASGLYETGRHVPDVHALGTTPYGVVVAGKVLLLGAALGLAAANTLVVNEGFVSRAGGVPRRLCGWRGLSWTTFGRTGRVEAAVLLLAVAGGALLTSTATAREDVLARVPDSVHDENVDGLFVTLEALPDGGDRARLVVHVRPTVRPDPAPASGVDVALTGPAGSELVELHQVEAGRFDGVIPAPEPGRWEAAVVVHRAGFSDSRMTARWTVLAPHPGPFQLATTVAALLLVALLVAVVEARAVGRPTRLAPSPPVVPAELRRQS